MSDFLLETGRQTLMLELQEASRRRNVWARILSARPTPLSTAKAK